ncbi:MAG TPA: monovalent cation/H(+) antiporter subunit G [Kofleriaceae bacterium]|nr:monovalent cation/H(+) antiporter subunit G [Kofleriaceae bacterium]
MIWLVDVLVLLGLLGLTVGVLGVCRLPQRFARIHSGATVLVVATLVIALVPAASGAASMLLRGLLVAALLGFTSPVAGNALVKLEHDMERRDGDDEGAAGARPPDPGGGGR